MTGEEYYNLKRGDKVKVICSFYDHDKGEILKVEYINSLENKIYCRSTASNDVDEIALIDVLNCLGLYNGEIPVNNKTIHLPFAPDDKVWFIIDNAVYQGKVTGYTITYNPAVRDPYPCINYILLFKNSGGFVEEVTNIHSSRCFRTKEELLKSL